jgi:hypothetical protein
LGYSPSHPNPNPLQTPHYCIYLPELNTILEINGPTHYLNNTKTKIGSSLYQKSFLPTNTKLLTIPYWKFKTITVADGHDILDFQHVLAYIEELIEENL